MNLFEKSKPVLKMSQELNRNIKTNIYDVKKLEITEITHAAVPLDVYAAT